MKFPKSVPTVSVAQVVPQRKSVVADAVSGLTFAVVNIPQAMANALLAGVDPVLGLYTLMVATPIGALFTSSVYMNISTTSALSVAAGDALIGIPGPAKTANMAILVLLVGIVQVLAGVFRLGSLLRFVSRSVMVGFISGVAALIVLGQIEDFTGYASSFQNKVLRLADYVLNLGQTHWATLFLSIVTVLVIVGIGYTPLKKVAMLIGLLVATLLAYLAQPMGIRYVGDIAVIPDQLLSFGMPNFLLAPNLIPSAIAIAIVGLVQGAGVSQNYPNPDGKFPNVSRDVIGQGVANIVTGFFRGIPAGGSMSGTALTVGSGAQTRWANIFAGLIVIPLVWIFGDLITLVPMSALAGLLVVVGFQSFKPDDVRTVWNTGKIPATAMVLTFSATLILPLQYAVFVGVAVSVLLHVFRSSNHVRLVEWVPVERGFPLERDAPATVRSNDSIMLYTYGSLFFAAAANVEKRLPEVGDAERAIVLLALRGRDEVGSTLIGVLLRYASALQARGGRLMLVGVDENVYQQLERTGALRLIGEENVFRSEPQLGQAMNLALAAARELLGQSSPPADVLPSPKDAQAEEDD